MAIAVYFVISDMKLENFDFFHSIFDAAEAFFNLFDIDGVTQSDPVGRTEPLTQVRDHFAVLIEKPQKFLRVFALRQYVKSPLGFPKIKSKI